MSTPQYNFTVTLDDLAFILQQIKIAEASTNPVTGEIENLPELVGSPLLPFGLRTVDGTWNSLLPGQERLGAADNVMPRLVPGVFHDAEGRPLGFFGPGDPGSTSSSYAQTAPGNMVFDSQPRIISNLIVDQTAGNPAAQAAADDRADNDTYPGHDTVQTSENGSLYIPNLSPDIGLSPPFSGMMALFGQFFDHGLDLITKGGGTVFVPLQPDDPLYVEGSPTNFMVLSRAVNTRGPGADGVLGNADDDLHGHTNSTTPFVDQNQTYTSHPSHQVFLREYISVDGRPLATGHLLSGAHGIANWGEVKAQAAAMLGIRLQDSDVGNVPLLATDRYGEFIRGANGFVQVVTSTGLVEGDPSANGGLGITLPANTLRTDHEFLIDIAHAAIPSTGLTADLDTTVGAQPNPNFDPTQPITVDNQLFLAQPAGTYDNELLDRHFVTGDGRGNENIGLTAIHAVFHSEHNRLVEDYKATILASGDLALINEWLAVDVAALPTTPAQIATLVWDGERLFQAGRFVTEMQYQHLVFEEFARAVQPSVEPFVFSASPDLDPAIFEEFANVVYRFGHSMLTEEVARLDGDLEADHIGLIQAFLNPVEFDKDGAVSAEDALGAIVRGMSRQVGNEIDEFVTEALRDNLVGLPLDLAALNIARARETGAPSFNEARKAFFEMTGDSQLKPYTSWADYAPHLKNPASIINFIAAYGTHSTITSETTVEGKRAAATLMVMGDFDLNGDGVINSDPSLVGPGYRLETAPADRIDFLTGRGAWNAQNSGLNKVDFWIGGLAEAKLEFGGMLGPTFNFVFEAQMERLQNGDRFYYLSRTQGLNLLGELEPNTFSAIIMRNSDLGELDSTTHLPASIFATPTYILEMNQDDQHTGIVGPNGLNGDPVRDNDVLNAINPLVIRVAPGADGNGGVLTYSYDGPDHVVLGGSAGNDTINGGRGMDTLWGDGGNDRLDGGDEADHVFGGDGDDIITDHGTPAGAADFLRGDEGNDVISNGAGNDIVFGGGGQDFFIVGPDFTEVFAGRGDDFAIGGNGSDVLMGNEGDDWLEGGEGFDSLSGENSQLFFNSSIIGHDVLNGQGNDTDYDGESGDDIMVQGVGIQRNNGMLGFDWAIHKGDPVAANSDLGIAIFNAQEPFILRDRFDSVEALSGWRFDDQLTGTNFPTGAVGEPGGILNGPESDSRLLQKNVGLIAGFQALLGQPALADPEAVVFDPRNGADILIGGLGSDRITGKAGNDLIDGDAWLNVRVSVRSATDPNVEVRSVDSIAVLRTEMLSGAINPGQLRIGREIISDPLAAAADVDTAVYSDVRSSYDITRNEDATWTIAHVRGTATDGTDRVRNIEQLQFLDAVMNLTGAPAIGDTTPTEGQALSALAGTILAFSGVPPEAVTYQWQSGSGSSFTNIAGATGLTFTPTQAQVGLQLRVVASFNNQLGVPRSIASPATSPVGDLATGTAGDNVLIGTAFDDELLGLGGNDLLNGAGGVDLLKGGTGNDTYVIDDFEDMIVELAGEGIDTVQTTLTSYALGEHLENLQFIGSLAVVGSGNELANIITGGSGNDILIGGGNDRLVGGLGNDTFLVVASGDVVVEGADAGIDLVQANADVYTLSANVENMLYTGFGNFTGTGNVLANTITGGAGNDTIDGLAGSDHLVGDLGNDLLRGGADSDVLEGNEGDDTLDGGAGADTMRGGSGDDSYVVDSTLDVVTELAGDGVDSVRTSLTTYALGSTVENLAFTGTAAFTGTGNDLANTISGGSGADLLDGGAGIDFLSGGAGNDIYVVDAALDVVNELAGQGTDLVRTTLASYSLFANVENLTFTGTGMFVGEGNALANVINGGADGDVLDGGLGNDTLAGGGGDDTYVVNSTFDAVIEAAGAGIDRINSTALTYTLAANVENLAFIGAGNFTGTGNALANSLFGGAGSDTLNGLAGADTMAGGAGNDTYIADSSLDVVVELANGGTDGVRTAALAFTLAENVENLVFVGAGGFAGTGNALANIISGGSGNDVLNGQGGTDTMNGGLGNDTYVVDVAGDTAIEAAGSGLDTVQSTALAYTLGANLENLVFTGSGAFAGTGNALANVLTGGAGADTLRGLDGNDRLIGAAGNDSLEGGLGNDVLVFNAGGFGTDTVLGFDFDAAGGQDLLDISGLGITAANFASQVSMIDSGTSVTVTIVGAGSVVLLNVADVGLVTSTDFILAV